MRHRDDWVHNRLPAVAGLNPEILFSRTDADTAFPPQVRDALKAVGYPLTGAVTKLGFAMGPGIEVPRSTMRTAYADLLLTFDGLVRLLGSE